MNLHEFQGKQILESYGANIQQGILAKTTEEALQSAKKLNQETGTDFLLLKLRCMQEVEEKEEVLRLLKHLKR